MIPFSDDHGLRDYRADVAGRPPRVPWMRLVMLIANVVALLFVIRACR